MIGKTNAITIIGGGEVDPTLDNKTHLFIRLTTVSGLSPSIHITKTDTSTLTIDWGDGSIETNSSSGVVSLGAHTYSAIGDYEITMWISSGSGTYSYGYGFAGSYFFGGYSNTYNKCLLKVYVGTDVSQINVSAFYLNSSLEYIYWGSSITSIGKSAFNQAFSLNWNNTFDNITAIDNDTFVNNYSATYFSFSDSLSSIGLSAFSGCFSVLVYKFYSTTPPTLYNTNVFANINPICKIYVPDASLTAYKTATNWSAFANYIYPLSDIE